MNEFLIELQAKLDEAKSKGLINETDINPPAELGRLADASGDEQSTRIKTPAV